MSVIDLIKKHGRTAFSFELLPPLKGNNIDKLFQAIDMLREFDPQYINITTHRSEYVYKDKGNGLYERRRVRRRPGSVAVAAAIKNKYGLPVVPHVLCSGYTREDTEYELIDLQFLEIYDLLVLRGDKARDDAGFVPERGGNGHALDLIAQVNDFNRGISVDGEEMRAPATPFTYGVACYPEKHEEAPNIDSDIRYLKMKQDAGAQYAVTQLFYDNSKFFSFVERARQAGVTMPIIPGIKPFRKLSQLTVIPKTFKVDLPQDLVNEALKCRSDEEAWHVGVEWGIAQCKELAAAGVPSLHFYSIGAADSIKAIAKEVY